MHYAWECVIVIKYPCMPIYYIGDTLCALESLHDNMNEYESLLYISLVLEPTLYPTDIFG